MSSAPSLGLDAKHSPVSGMRARSRGSDVAIPKVSRPMRGWFTWYSRRYLRRHFHSLRVSRSGPPPIGCSSPLVIYSNHASWWDPLTCLVLAKEFFAERTGFAPIDAGALKRYPFFRKLGFFPVETGSARGAVQFLQTSQAVLIDPRHMLWLTPQGRFADVRERPANFQAGLGHLARRVEHAAFVPLALEYVFWEERLPEVLARFGEPLPVPAESGAHDAHTWTHVLEQHLEANQNALAYEVLRRDPTDFQTVLRGGAGQGGVYDWWRGLKARVRGETFTKEHGDK